MRPPVPGAFAVALLVLAWLGATLANVFVVDDVADPLPITGTLTLRQAITAANSLPGPHQILFNLPGPGVSTIAPLSPLPPIVRDDVTIDGFSQPGAMPGWLPPASAQLSIQLDGWVAGPSHGLHVLASRVQIRGLAVMNFAWDGIRIEGTPEPGTRGNLVYACFVGTDASGSLAQGNGTAMSGGIWAGIDILCSPGPAITWCSDNVIEACLVSGNYRCGVQVSSCPPSDCYFNTVMLSYVGSDRSGLLALPNAGSGIVLAEGTHDDFVYNNVVSANGQNGVDLTGNPMTLPPANTTHNTIVANAIGLGADYFTPLGNGARGVSIGIFETATFFGGFVPENSVTSNQIAHNALAGVCVWENPLDPLNADRNSVQQNLIFANGGLGIDLGDDGVTPNDPGDPDLGANDQLNTPLVLHAFMSSGGFVTVGGIADPGRTVDVYRALLDPSGCGEGDAMLGRTAADANGNWSLQAWTLVPGDHVSAIAHDTPYAAWSNTSEFSPSIKVLAVTDAGGPAAARFGLWPQGANPFRTATSFRWAVPEEGECTLRVYDVAGAVVRTLAAGRVPAGEHLSRWDGRDDRGGPVGAGVYFVELRAGGAQSVRRVARL